MRVALTVASILLASCAGAPPPPACPPAPPPAPPPPAATVDAPKPAAPEEPRVATPEAALRRLLAADKAREAWFSPDFLAKVPVSKVDEILASLRAEAGAFEDVRADGPRFVLVYAKATVAAGAAIDADGRFTTLFVRPPEPKSATLEQAVEAFRALPGKVSLLVVTDGAERAALAPELSLGVGSAFKLAVLAELRAQIDAKKRAWKDVVALSPSHRSLPSGHLHEWPDGAPMTVYGLAALMISQSDNTATDEVLALVGRTKVEARAPSNKPFLATREMFQLKAPSGAEDLAAWRRGGEADRRKLLETLAKKPAPPVETYPDAPTALDVEWFFSARELCALMGKVADLPLMSINPGLAKKADWDRVAFKGGSEPGVHNLTTWLEKGGKKHCVAATWNAPQKLDAGAFHAAYTKALVALGK
jgi:beta-lactamase class A